MGRIKKMYIGFIMIICGIVLDQVTKIIVHQVLKPKGDIPIIKNFFHFTYVENRGGAWGVFSGKFVFFIIITIVALGIFGYLFKDFDLKGNTLYSIALTMLIAGTIGNFIDRVVYGFVTDFLNFYIFGYNFPVFNVADMLLTGGFTLMIIYVLFGGKQ